jgi:hypothetical protein
MKKNKGFSLMINVGQYGGFYFHYGYTKRICLGWIAFTIFPIDLDGVIRTHVNLHETKGQFSPVKPDIKGKFITKTN